MAEYITKEQAYNSVDERIDELKANKEFNIVKEICISGVKKYISAIPPADVVEREKIDKAIEEIRGYARFHRDKIHNDVEQGKYLAYEKCIEILKRNIGE